MPLREMTFEHCIDCAGYGYHQTSPQGFVTCLTCGGKPTRAAGSFDWEPFERKRITESYKGCAKVGYVWHFACANCKHRFLDGLTFAENKKRGLIPCCTNPQYEVHSPHAKPCTCET